MHFSDRHSLSGLRALFGIAKVQVGGETLVTSSTVPTEAAPVLTPTIAPLSHPVPVVNSEQVHPVSATYKSVQIAIVSSTNISHIPDKKIPCGTCTVSFPPNQFSIFRMSSLNSMPFIAAHESS